MKKQNLILLFLLILIPLLLIFKPIISKNLASLFKSKPINELETVEFVNNILKSTGEYDLKLKTAFFENQTVGIPENLANLPLNPEATKQVLGLKAYAAEGEKWIEIDLDNQKLYAHEGNTIVYEFPISSGVPWLPTVTGEFHIWSKLKYTRMAGGCDVGDCYDLPNVPYTQYFYKGFALHGAYWHNDFGNPRSHGCVNLRIPDAEKLFYWTSPPADENTSVVYSSDKNPGTRVVVHGVAKLANQ